MDLPSLRGVEAFLIAAESLSFRSAAERLNVTISAVSHRIHALEKEIGVALFARQGNKLTLTPAGVDFRDRILPVIDELRRATQAIYGVTESNVLRITSYQMFHQNWLIPRIGGFFALHPEAQVELLTLRHRKVTFPDITIRILRPAEVDADSEQIFDWNIFPVCSPDFIKTHGLRTPADLARVPLIDTILARSWPGWLEAAGLPPDLPGNMLMVDSPALILDLITAGVGVGILPDFMAARYLDNGLVRPFEMSCSYPGGVFMNRGGEFDRSVVKTFRSWLKQQVSASIS